jgi:HicB_like antitoxin of bacterial toxin-antitoxin system
MEEDGEAIPAPTSMDAIASDPHNRGAFATFVTVEPRSRIQRLNITMNADVLKRIDAYASEVGMSRSAFLAHAATRELATGRFERRSPKGKSAPKSAPKRVGARA